jgi:hypothetical protein
MNRDMAVEVVIAGDSALDTEGIPVEEATWVEAEVTTPIPLAVKSTLEMFVLKCSSY